VLHGEGPGSEIQYRLAWSRTYLKGMGLVGQRPRCVGADRQGPRPEPGRGDCAQAA
jgi:hypothetical protein